MKVTTQKELDAALANPRVTSVVIDSPVHVRLMLSGTGDKYVEVTGNSVIEWADGNSVIKRATGNSVIKWATGNSVIEWADGNSVIKRATGNSVIKWADGNSVIEWADGNSVIKRATGNSVIEWADGNSVIEWADGNSVIKWADGNSVIKWADGNSVIEWATGNSVIKRATGNSVIERATGNSVIERADGNSVTQVLWSKLVKASAAAIVRSYQGSKIGTVSAGVTVYLYRGAATVEGGNIVDLRDLDLDQFDQWADWHSVEIIDGNAILYKAVDDDLRSGHGFEYPIGKTVSAPDWRDDNQCGGGLHFSPSPIQALYYASGATRFLKVSIPVGDIRPINDDQDGPKVKARGCTVVEEVDKFGAQVKATVAA